MDLTKFIQDQNLVILPALWVIGAIIKNTPNVKDWLIPYILIGTSIVLCCIMFGFTAQNILQGIIIGGTAIGMHQLVKQSSK